MPQELSSASSDSFDSAINAPAGGDPRTAASVATPMQSLTNRTRWTWNRLKQVIGSFAPISAISPSKIESVDVAADTFTLTGHGLSDSDPVRFQTASGGSLPSGVAEGTVYFVVSSTSDTFKVSATSGGSAIDITGSLSGSCYAVKVTDAAANIYVPASGSLPAGPLRLILNLFGLLGTANTWTSANTFTGAVNLSNAAGNSATLGTKLIRSGTGARDVYRVVPHPQAGATQSVTATDSDIHYFVEPTADCDCTLSDGTDPGQVVWLVAVATFASFDINFKSNASTVASFPGGATRCAVMLEWRVSQWKAIMWTKDVSNI